MVLTSVHLISLPQTEGFDARIVNSLLDAISVRPSRRPNHIKYEQVHLQADERTALEARLRAADFVCTSDSTDTTCSSVNARTPLPWILHRAGINSDAPAGDRDLGRSLGELSYR